MGCNLLTTGIYWGYNSLTNHLCTRQGTLVPKKEGGRVGKIYLIGSMGRTVYLPTFIMNFKANVGKYSIHGSYGYIP